MKKISKVCIILFFALFLITGILTSGWKCSEASGEDIEALHIDKSSPTQGLMRIISSHTSKMLDAIMIGDFNAVLKESVEIINASDVVMRMFFSADGKAGEWFSKASTLR